MTPTVPSSRSSLLFRAMKAARDLPRTPPDTDGSPLSQLGLSAVEPRPAWALQASRVCGALVAALGLLVLANRWGHRTRLWLPVALVWVGSGALAAFDGLTLTLNRLFLLLGSDGSGRGWAPADTFLVVKVLVGLLAAAVGALAVMAAMAAQDATVDERPRPK